MITLIEAKNPHGETLSLPLQTLNPGYVVADIDGLGPVKATLTSANFAGRDGAQFQASRREPRNITLTLEFEPDPGFDPTYTVTGLRQRLYQYFMTKVPVDLYIHSDEYSVAKIEGIVEAFEADMFTAEPSVSISIMCFDPDFQLVNTVTLEGETNTGGTYEYFENSGTVPSGILFTITPTTNMTLGFTLYLRDSAFDVTSVLVDKAILAGESVEFCSIPGKRFVNHIVSGVKHGIFYASGITDPWPQISPGQNGIRVYASGAAQPWTLEYIPRLGGF